ncbi:MAG: site-2 protease family protein [Firmicutes bacterium]|nr:site-2 protease family protein [Bacillota bacterium]MDH7495543.1 site-2 protease family protein [Bacillota bacterium]
MTLPIILLSLTVHECAHAAMANALGDPTARWQGRLTLNPLAHLDVFGTLTLILTQRFGWAKPVPVNPAYFKDWRRGMMLVGVAGPLANVALAFLLAIPLRMGIAMPYALGRLVVSGIIINLGLAAFNLIPVPPLDGSRLLLGVLRGRNLYVYHQLESYGPFILLLLVFSGATRIIVAPIMSLLALLVLGQRLF